MNEMTQPAAGEAVAAGRATGTLERASQSPPWAPGVECWDRVPDQVKQAIREVVAPLYQQTVVEARTPMDRALGMTLAHLTWLEVLDEEDHRREYAEIDAILGLARNRESKILMHLRMLDSKIRLGRFLIDLEDTRRRWRREDEAGASRTEPQAEPAPTTFDWEPSCLAQPRVEPDAPPAPSDPPPNPASGDENSAGAENVPQSAPPSGATESGQWKNVPQPHPASGARNPADAKNVPQRAPTSGAAKPEESKNVPQRTSGPDRSARPASERFAPHDDRDGDDPAAHAREDIAPRGEPQPAGRDGLLRPDDQKRLDRARARIAARPAVFAGQGTVESFRRDGKGRAGGPYFRLIWRERGKRRSLYLGRSPAVAEEIRATLRELKRPRREARQLRRVKSLARAALRRDKQHTWVRGALEVLGEIGPGKRRRCAHRKLLEMYRNTPPDKMPQFAAMIQKGLLHVGAALEKAEVGHGETNGPDR